MECLVRLHKGEDAEKKGQGLPVSHVLVPGLAGPRRDEMKSQPTQPEKFCLVTSPFPFQDGLGSFLTCPRVSQCAWFNTFF